MIPLVGTPTSLVFGSHNDSDLANIHNLKDYVNHELVPILTMDPNSTGTSSSNLLKANVNLPLNTMPPPPPSVTSCGSATSPPNSCTMLNNLGSPLVDTLTPTTQSSLDSSGGNHALKGVYTLAEEPELEAQETQIDRI